jgi:hypothetical protein
VETGVKQNDGGQHDQSAEADCRIHINALRIDSRRNAEASEKNASPMRR